MCVCVWARARACVRACACVAFFMAPTFGYILGISTNPAIKSGFSLYVDASDLHGTVKNPSGGWRTLRFQYFKIIKKLHVDFQTFPKKLLGFDSRH